MVRQARDIGEVLRVDRALPVAARLDLPHHHRPQGQRAPLRPSPPPRGTIAPSTLRYCTLGPSGGAGNSRSIRAPAAVCTATYAAPARSVTRRSVVPSSHPPLLR